MIFTTLKLSTYPILILLFLVSRVDVNRSDNSVRVVLKYCTLTVNRMKLYKLVVTDYVTSEIPVPRDGVCV